MVYMRQEKFPWIDTRLQPKEMNFLRDAISEENKENTSKTLAGNIFKSEILIDKDNWFYEHSLKKLTERMLYRDWDVYYKYCIEKEEPPPKFELYSLWVNYMKQHEFNPIHDHGGLYSFVIFMRIPTHWKEQHALFISANSNTPSASDFQVMWTEKNSEFCLARTFSLSPEDEGRILFFPAWLKHQVYPFYECEEERVTISGNIRQYDPNKPTEEQEIPVSEDEKKENDEKMIKILENNIRVMKKELKSLEKTREKDGIN